MIGRTAAIDSLRAARFGAVSVAATVAVLLAGSHMAARAPDIELGRYLATECMTCHRSATTGGIPNIFGIAEATFTRVMNAYRARELPNPVMQSIAGRLKDDEIEALAAFFARTRKP